MKISLSDTSDTSVSFFLLTTDFLDLTDVNHERKRKNPFYLCNLWLKTIQGIRN